MKPCKLYPLLVVSALLSSAQAEPITDNTPPNPDHVLKAIEASDLETTEKIKSIANKHSIADSDDAAYLEALAIVIEKMRSYYNLDKIDISNRNFREYFSSDRFNSDYANGAWSGDLGVTIDGVPFNLGANSSNEQLREFKEKVKKSKNIQLSDETYLKVAESFLPPEAFTVISDIFKQRTSKANGFKHSHELAGSHIVFKVNFTKDVEAIPWPEIRSIRVVNGRLDSDSLKTATQRKRLNAELVLTAIRNNANDDVILTIETTLGSVVHKVPSLNAAEQKNIVPTGTIIAWYKNSGAIPSGWAICDGTNKTPDLRNRFLRGGSSLADVGTQGGSETHAHTVRGTTTPEVNGNWNPTESLDNGGGSNWAHQHNFTAGSDAQPNIPPYTTVIFLMKL